MTNENIKQAVVQLLSPYADDMQDERLGVFLALSVGRVLINSGNINISDDIKDAIPHISDWLKAAIINNASWMDNLDDQHRPKKLMKFSSIEQITQETDKAMRIASQQLSNIKILEGDEKLIAELKDGYHLVSLLTPAALDKESNQMQHCIGQGAYDECLDDDSYLFLSLRNSAGKPHATMQIQNNNIIQMQGKQNEFPMKKYIDAMIPFFKSQKYSINGMRTDKIGFISDKDGNWHDINNLPDNLIIPDSLNLSRTLINKLPKNFTVEGHLNIEDRYIRELPEGLKVKGNLYASNTKLETLPSDIEVGGLDISRTIIKELPNNIKKYDLLNVSRTLIKELPESITEVQELIVHDTKIIKLPNSLEIVGDLDISKTEISIMPQNIKYDNLNADFSKIRKLPYLKNRSIQTLNLFDSKIEELPDNLTVNTMLNIGRTPIKKLPKNLTIKGNAEFIDCLFKEFPNDIIMEGNINLTYSNIKNINNITHVKGSLNLSGTKCIKFLPGGLTVDKHLILSHSKIKKLPLNLTVEGDLFFISTDITKLPSCLSVKVLNLYDTKITNITEGITVGTKIIINENQISDFPDSIRDDVWVLERMKKHSTPLNIKTFTVGEFRKKALENMTSNIHNRV